MSNDANLMSLVEEAAANRCRRDPNEPYLISECVEVNPAADVSASNPPDRAWYVTIQFPYEGDNITEVRVRQVAVGLRGGTLSIEKEWEY